MAHIRYEDFDFESDIVDREMKFYEFYKHSISYNFEVECSPFRLSVTEILDPSNGPLLTKDAKTSEKAYQCARLLQFAIHDTCLVMQRFYEFMKEFPQVLEDFVYKSRIQMCCFVDGPALEAIAISKVIDKALIQFGFADNNRTQITVKVVCRDESWKLVHKRLGREINKELKKVNLQFDFLSTEFTNPFPKKLQEFLKKAHIVTMVKFLSSLSSSKKKHNIIKNTLENMRKNAVLFYLDTETKNDYQDLSSMAEKCDPFSEVYFSPTSNKFQLQNEVFKVNADSDFDTLWKLVKNKFDPTVCSTWIKAFVKKTTPNAEEKLKVVTKTSTGLSSNKIRNSTKKFKLVGKFSCMDMEKKNKDDSHRRDAIKASVSRYASFDDD